MYLLEIDEYLFGVVDKFSAAIRDNPMPIPYTPDLSGYSLRNGRLNHSGSFVVTVNDQQLVGLEPYLPGIEVLGSFDKWWVLRDRKNGRPFTLTVYGVERGDYRKWQETKEKLWTFYKCLVDRDDPQWAAFSEDISHWIGEPKEYRIPFVFEDCETFVLANSCDIDSEEK